MKLRTGSLVPMLDQLQEGYHIDQRKIIANVGVEKLEPLLVRFIDMIDEPMFFFLELPTNENDEPKDADGKIPVFHKDIYYLDGCDRKNAKSILDQVSKILLADGMS